MTHGIPRAEPSRFKERVYSRPLRGVDTKNRDAGHVPTTEAIRRIGREGVQDGGSFSSLPFSSRARETKGRGLARGSRALTHLQTRVRVVDNLVRFHVDHPTRPLSVAWRSARE